MRNWCSVTNLCRLKSKFNPMTTAHRLKVIHEVVREEPVVSPGLLELWLNSRSGSSLVWRGCIL